jgi:lipopolysaccharide biosynthesis protein
MTRPVRLISFYLPQFHPIQENDCWWGKGFTEWRNVVQARQLFHGHQQPHLPGELGFYDLRLAETRDAQAALARDFGIEGFCYYHYWFNGRRLLGRPVDEMLESGRPDLPFCLCWANEDWTRAWDGRSGERLISHAYSEEDDRRHLQWLSRSFRDERYMRVEGRPLFLVYRASQLPDAIRTTTTWRQEARRLGVGELFLCRVESFADERGDPSQMGFDAAVEFQPDWVHLGEPLRQGTLRRALGTVRVANEAAARHRVYDYGSVADRMMSRPKPPYPRFSCVTPGWDNTARRRTEGVILKDSSPTLYERWLTATIQRTVFPSPGERLVFINAWNEWGEGNHLEPCQRWGRAYLEATRRALEHVGVEQTESTRVHAS